MAQNEMTVDILENGDVRIVTDEFSGAVHMSADAFMAFVQKELGDPASKVIKTHNHHHGHNHHHHHIKK